MINIDQANETAVARMMAARPILKTVATARDVVPGMRDGPEPEEVLVSGRRNRPPARAFIGFQEATARILDAIRPRRRGRCDKMRA